MADSTVIWLFQPHASAGQTRVIDVIKGEGVGLDWYVGELEKSRERHGSAHSWLWGDHILPHDVAVREMGTGKSRIERLRELGLEARICPNLPVPDGIQAARALIPRCWFDRTRCARGLEALRQYRRHYDGEAGGVSGRRRCTTGPAIMPTRSAISRSGIGRRTGLCDAADQAGYAVGGLRGAAGEGEPARRQALIGAFAIVSAIFLRRVVYFRALLKRT